MASLSVSISKHSLLFPRLNQYSGDFDACIGYYCSLTKDGQGAGIKEKLFDSSCFKTNSFSWFFHTLIFHFGRSGF